MTKEELYKVYPILERLENERIFSVDMYEDEGERGWYVSEECDQYFSVEINYEDALQLSEAFKKVADYILIGTKPDRKWDNKVKAAKIEANKRLLEDMQKKAKREKNRKEKEQRLFYIEGKQILHFASSERDEININFKTMYSSFKPHEEFEISYEWGQDETLSISFFVPQSCNDNQEERTRMYYLVEEFLKLGSIEMQHMKREKRIDDITALRTIANKLFG